MAGPGYEQSNFPVTFMISAAGGATSKDSKIVSFSNFRRMMAAFWARMSSASTSEIANKLNEGERRENVLTSWFHLGHGMLDLFSRKSIGLLRAAEVPEHLQDRGPSRPLV